tara:strand:- start:2553 stop:2798 length:246 start_codon:yes stop_codon:yes gene_type:complete
MQHKIITYLQSTDLKLFQKIIIKGFEALDSSEQSALIRQRIETDCEDFFTELVKDVENAVEDAHMEQLDREFDRKFNQRIY